MKPKVVLHVSEAFGGGITSSLFSFAESSPHVQHHLLVSERNEDSLSKDPSELFRSVKYMSRNFLAARREIFARFRELDADYVHLHSTFAGIYGRLAGIPATRLIYSPHGFSFHRRSDPAYLRAVYYFVEKSLSLRSAHFAGVSLDEVRIAREMNRRVRSVFVPNSSDAKPMGNVLPVDEGCVRVALMGRLCAQKDPHYLLEVMHLLPPSVRSRLSFTWIGGGDSLATKALQDAGIRVTGWLNHAAARAHLERCDLYMHVAAWEGFPMTVIEAAALEKPILLRSIAAFDGFQFPPETVLMSPSEAAYRLCDWVGSADKRAASHELSRMVRDICSRERQAAALYSLYGYPQQ